MFVEAYDDLYRKRGLLETPSEPIPPNPIFSFQIRKTPHAFWVAEQEGEIVGFSDSFVRDSFWYFSWLFISPSNQGQDIGRNLLERTLASWKEVQITNRATMTFAVNPTSQSLYMRYGMYPREPAYFVRAPSKVIKEEKRQAAELDFEELANLGEGSDILRQMDEHVLGFSLDWRDEYFFETKARCYVFLDKNSPAGYVYVRPSGVVGPMAVKLKEFTKPVLDMALEIAATLGVENVGYYTPGSNVGAIELALKYKMRFDPYVFMSTKLFAKWENYIFNSAALT